MFGEVHINEKNERKRCVAIYEDFFGGKLDL